MNKMSRLLTGWSSVMFPYGMYREWNASSYQKITMERVVISVACGFCYTTPFGAVKLRDTFDRLQGRHDKSVYFELTGYNYDRF